MSNGNTSTWSLPSTLSRNIFKAHEALLGRPTFRYWKELERTQHLTREEIRALQLDRLRHLLSTALKNTPWHAERIRNAGINPETMSWEEFERIPLMDKEDARTHGDEMVWREAPGGIFRYNTGGSTGEPLIFYFGRKRQAVDAACRMRARHWWGLQPGDREVFLWGAPTELKRTDKIKQIRDRMCNQVLLNAFEMSAKRMDNYLSILEKFQPKCIYGYASSLVLLAEHAKTKGWELRLPQLKVVCTTGEPLYPHQRESIGQVFKAPVANEYGARDAGLIALESPAEQLLVNSEWIIIEIVDGEGNPIEEGETGEIVITNLASEVQPFIRYRTGDMTTRITNTCKNHRGLEVINEIAGRNTDFILRADGTIMHALSLIYILRDIPGVRKFKIIQNTLDQITVLIVKEDSLWHDDMITHIEEGLRVRLGNEVNISIQLVPNIPAEKSGKYKYVTNQLKHKELKPEMLQGDSAPNYNFQ